MGGVTVKLATLHNEEDLRRKDLRVGDEVIVLRAGDVIPQVLSPAPHAVERPDRSAPPEPPDAVPVVRHADGQARGPRLHEVPQPRRVPGPAVPAPQALRLARRDGHRGAGRGARAPAPAGRARAPRRRPLPARRPSSSRRSRASADQRRAARRRRRRLEGPRLRPRPLRGRDRGGRLRHRPQPGPAVPHDRRAPGGHAGGDRPDAGDRPDRRRAHPRAARAARDARAAGRPARRRGCTSRRRGRRRGRARCRAGPSC